MLVKTIACIVFLLFAPNVLSQEPKLGAIAGRPVELNLVKADDLSPAAWPREQIELTQTSATVTSDANIYMLLQANGIAPDPGAFTIVYDLNPQITDVNSVAPNTVLQLPAVSAERGLQKILQNRELVELTVDPEIRSHLNARIEALQLLIPSVTQVIAEPSAQLELKNLIGWYQQIEKRFKRKTDPPLRQATLVELLNEADLLSSAIEGALKKHRQVTENERKQIAAIYADVRLEMTQYGEVLARAPPKAEGVYSVTVNVSGIDPKFIDGLRVYYTYNGLFRPLPAQPPITSFGFRQLGPGKSENLFMKNYWLWAAKDGDPNHPATPPYELHIDASSPASLSVDLRVPKGNQK
ncbi:MAG: hypothetical protein C5B54_06200 [Acidobacteria bacterium]|nr:MAG: hypothetical protein C5B54_06200 [Acidobacteriota bacterium]